MTLPEYWESRGEVLTHYLYTLQFPPSPYFYRIRGKGPLLRCMLRLEMLKILYHTKS